MFDACYRDIMAAVIAKWERCLGRSVKMDSSRTFFATWKSSENPFIAALKRIVSRPGSYRLRSLLASYQS
jgi:hypothetical protein